MEYNLIVLLKSVGLVRTAFAWQRQVQVLERPVFIGVFVITFPHCHISFVIDLSLVRLKRKTRLVLQSSQVSHLTFTYHAMNDPRETMTHGGDGQVQSNHNGERRNDFKPHSHLDVFCVIPPISQNF